MHTKITQSGGRRYLQLVEGYRNEAGKVRHRVIANLGRVDDLAPLDPLINGLSRSSVVLKTPALTWRMSPPEVSATSSCGWPAPRR